MLLKDKYFHIAGSRQEDGRTVYTVDMLPGCEVYAGHFPGKPICPGACNIEMVKELALLTCGSEADIESIHRCRMLKLMTPTATPTVEISILMSDNGSGVEASISREGTLYMDFSARLKTQAE